MRKDCSSKKAAGGCQNQFSGYSKSRDTAEEILQAASTATQHYYISAYSNKRKEEWFFFRTGRSDSYFLHELPEYWETRGKAYGAIQHLRSRYPEFNGWYVHGTYLYVSEVS